MFSRCRPSSSPALLSLQDDDASKRLSHLVLDGTTLGKAMSKRINIAPRRELCSRCCTYWFKLKFSRIPIKKRRLFYDRIRSFRTNEWMKPRSPHVTSQPRSNRLERIIDRVPSYLPSCWITGVCHRPEIQRDITRSFVRFQIHSVGHFMLHGTKYVNICWSGSHSPFQVSHRRHRVWLLRIEEEHSNKLSCETKLSYKLVL